MAKLVNKRSNGGQIGSKTMTNFHETFMDPQASGYSTVLYRKLLEKRRLSTCPHRLLTTSHFSNQLNQTFFSMIPLECNC